MKLVGYVRVSTDKQAEEGLGLAVQDKAVRSWAKANGHRLIGVCRDEGVSGTKDSADRPGLADALTAICDNRAKGIVVHRLDRLARTLTVQEAILGRVWQCEGGVFTAESGEVPQDDPDDPMRRAMRQMVGVFGELERAMVVARMRAGRKHKAAKGGYAGFGSPPFGFKAEERALVPDEREQEAIALMVAMRREGASLPTIAARLTEEGFTSKRGGPWHPTTVQRALVRAGADPT